VGVGVSLGLGLGLGVGVGVNVGLGVCMLKRVFVCLCVCVHMYDMTDHIIDQKQGVTYVIFIFHTQRIRTGWRRLIGCLKLQFIFCKRATNYRALLRKMTYKDKQSYASSLPCTCDTCETCPIQVCDMTHLHVMCIYIHMTCRYTCIYIHMLWYIYTHIVNM